jgi:moderate conductance mechanosensitive channel
MPGFASSLLGSLLDASNWPGAIFFALLFLLLALVGARSVGIFTRRHSRYLPDPTASRFVSQLLQVAVFLVAVILYAQLVPELRSFGTALLTGVSIISVIIGLAAQSTLGNVISGIAILLYRPFEVGDQVQLATPKGVQTGTIESLTLGYTMLHGSDDEEIVVPNSVMASAVIIKLRSEIKVGPEESG